MALEITDFLFLIVGGGLLTSLLTGKVIGWSLGRALGNLPNMAKGLGQNNAPPITDLAFMKNLKPEDLKDDMVFKRTKELYSMKMQASAMQAFGSMGSKGGGIMGTLLNVMMMGPMMKQIPQMMQGMGNMFGSEEKQGQQELVDLR